VETPRPSKMVKLSISKNSNNSSSNNNNNSNNSSVDENSQEQIDESPRPSQESVLHLRIETTEDNSSEMEEEAD
jgi:hypothetical protein